MTSIAAIHQGTHPRQQGERRGASGNSRIPGRWKCECRGSRRRGLTRQALGVGAEHRVEPVRRRFDLKWTRKTYAAQASGEVATDVTILQGPGGGVAGAHAERLAVIIVSSSPNTNDAGENHILHHTVGATPVNSASGNRTSRGSALISRCRGGSAL